MRHALVSFDVLSREDLGDVVIPQIDGRRLSRVDQWQRDPVRLNITY